MQCQALYSILGTIKDFLYIEITKTIIYFRPMKTLGSVQIKSPQACEDQNKCRKQMTWQNLGGAMTPPPPP